MATRAKMLATCVCLVLAAAGATAYAGSEDLVVGPEEGKRAVAVCSAGKIATAGGFSSADNNFWELLASRPKNGGWEVGLQNVTSSQQQFATLERRCLPADRFVTKGKAKHVKVDPFGAKYVTVRVKCPDGTTVAGGGFGPSTGGSGPADVVASRPDGSKVWLTRSRVAVNDSPLHAKVRAYAICDTHAADSMVRKDSVTIPPRSRRGDGEPFEVVAACKSSETFTGGGFSSGNDLNVYYTDVLPSDDSFTVAGRLQSTEAITAYAVCRL